MEAWPEIEDLFFRFWIRLEKVSPGFSMIEETPPKHSIIAPINSEMILDPQKKAPRLKGACFASVGLFYSLSTDS